MVDYPLESGSGSITVATVRPETMLADTAIAVHPDDERYTRLIGEAAILPLVGRRLPIIADEYVKTDFGTGALKITPGHDPNDFEIGRKHGLEEISVIGEDGLHDRRGLRGPDGAVEGARTVVAALRARGPRSPAPSPTRTTCRTRTARARGSSRSSRCSGSATWRSSPGRRSPRRRTARCASTPRSPWTGVYLDWLENIRPWCVSRQLWWGHQIPVWYRGEETHCGMDAAGGRGLGARPRRARHVVLLGAVAVRHARLARGDARAARLLPDRRALHGARHHLPLGRADGDVRASSSPASCRSPTCRSTRSSRRPTAGGCRSRSAPASTRSTRSTSTAPTRCASACWRCPRPRTCASPRSGCSQGRDLANKLWNASRLILLRRAGGRGAVGRAGGDGRGPLDPRRGWSASPARTEELIDGFELSARGARALRLLLVRAVRLVPRAGQAAPVRRDVDRRRSRPRCCSASTACCACCTR